ncbi:DUF6531 domain-containing protein [Streptomyces sp. NPDC051322]|uniref:DUF6531 domain-containing protein n=1 Tax=Streptomyces sp. NPDC051322 TaxID=3154645 RepID=UPI00344B356B
MAPNYQPGQTTWNVAADWTGEPAATPRFIRMQVYQASDNKLVATRMNSENSFSANDAETTAECLRWIGGGSAPHTCVWSAVDGVFAGKAGTVYYAKLSYATEMTNHFYKVPGEAKPTYAEYWLPTKWTATVTSPGAPAIYTPGIGQSLSGACTCFYQTSIADPVNTATGAVTETIDDTTVPGMGFPLTLTRNYSSAATDSDGLLGKGWKLSFESRITPETGKATLYESDGARITFTKNSDGTYAAPAPVRYVLTATSGGFKVTNIDHTSRTFDAAGVLSSWTNGSGEGLTFSYSGGNLTKITDAVGRETTLDVDTTTGRLNSVTLPDTHKVTYGYVGGQLASVTGTDGGITKYTYLDGLLSTVVDPNQNTVTQNFYDPSTGRIKKQIDASGNSYSFSWTSTNGAPAGSGESDMTDPNGGIWTDIYQAGVLMNSYRPEGGGNDREYDQHLNDTAEYDANGSQTLRTYDARGNLASQMKGGTTELFEFDTTDRLKTYTNGRGFKTVYGYDGTSDRIKTVTGPNGVTTYTYTPDGQIETEQAPGGGVTRYAYDSTGLLKSVTTPEGNQTTHTYEAGRIKTTTDPRGNVPGADPAKYTTHFDYDDHGRLWKATDPDNHTTTYTYDSNGNTKTVADPLTRVTTYDYDSADRLEKVTGPDKKFSTTEYDKQGNPKARVDEINNRTTYGYDSENHLVSVTTPRGNLPNSDPAKYTTTYGYDGNGNLEETVDPTGAATTTKYDALDRPTEVTDPLNHVTSTKYDENGNVKSVTDPRQKTTVYTYTDDDQVETVRDPRGKVTTYAYDAARYLKSETTPLGHTTTWTYDHDGRPTTSVDPRGNVTGTDPAKYATTYSYDAAGNLKKTTDPLGHTETAEYNAQNQQTLATNANSESTKTTYDELGRIKTVTAPDGGLTTYGYDIAGDIQTRTDDNAHTTAYAYDDAHRLKTVTDPLNHKVSYSYDADGNQETVTNARGVKTTTTHDALGQPVTIQYSDSTPAVTTVYDAAGNRHQITDATGKRTLDYNENNQLTAVSVPGQTKGFAYTYDDAGNLATRTLPHGRTSTYTYDDDGKRHTSTTDNSTVTYGYDDAGNLTTTRLPTANGYSEARTINAAGQLTDIASTKAGTTLSAWHAVLDPAGQPKRVDSTRQSTAKSQYYTYDAAGRLNTECSSTVKADSCPTGAPTTMYTYDKTGNRKSRTDAKGTTTNYTYNDADELTKTVTGSTATGYEYDSDGNQTKAGNQTYGYDPNNQLTSMTAGGKTWGFTYDSDGNRSKRTKTGVSLAWDINNDIPQLAAEYTSTGSLYADYEYNPDGAVESEHRSSAGTDALYYYHRDLIGSITDLTTASGSQAKTYEYSSAFGAGGPGVDSNQPNNNFGYAGQYKEPAGGEDASLADALGYNMRARTYDPDQGRFTSPDPYNPSQEDPGESSYAYVGNGPTYRYDPAGTCWWIPNSNDGACFHHSPGIDWGAAAKLGAKHVGDMLSNAIITTAGIGAGYLGRKTGVGSALNVQCGNQYSLIYQWLTGSGGAKYFGPGQSFLENLKKDSTVSGLRSDFITLARTNNGNVQGEQRQTRYRDPATIPQLVTDLAGMISNGRVGTRNPADAFLGSYSLNGVVSAVSKPSRTITVQFTANNTTDKHSFNHQYDMPDITAGPGATMTETFNWSEILRY